MSAAGFEFQPWPKIARLNREITVTEKIDGTNGSIIIDEDGVLAGVQSRKRLITPEDDNFGFARWAHDNAHGLGAALGPGRHYGEWWGSGVQRGYGLPKGEKRFSLFNTARYVGLDCMIQGLGTVPVLYQGPFGQMAIEDALTELRVFGSKASWGFPNPEGVVVFHKAAQQMFKVTLEGDEEPKSLRGAA